MIFRTAAGTRPAGQGSLCRNASAKARPGSSDGTNPSGIRVGRRFPGMPPTLVATTGEAPPALPATPRQRLPRGTAGQTRRSSTKIRRNSSFSLGPAKSMFLFPGRQRQARKRADASARVAPTTVGCHPPPAGSRAPLQQYIRAPCGQCRCPRIRTGARTSDAAAGRLRQVRRAAGKKSESTALCSVNNPLRVRRPVFRQNFWRVKSELHKDSSCRVRKRRFEPAPPARAKNRRQPAQRTVSPARRTSPRFFVIVDLPPEQAGVSQQRKMEVRVVHVHQRHFSRRAQLPRRLQHAVCATRRYKSSEPAPWPTGCQRGCVPGSSGATRRKSISRVFTANASHK